MKMAKAFMVSILVAAGVLNITPASAAHFTVGGSLDGNFQIAGTVSFWASSGPGSPQTFFPDQSDVDTPADNGMPITVLPNPDSAANFYNCNITMQGNVTNGAAYITSMRVIGTTPVCNRIEQSLSSQGHFPWKMHALSQPGAATAMIKGWVFYSAGLFSCSNATVMINLGGGYASFDQVAGTGGCHVTTFGDASVVSPSVDVVYP
ncbi:hypothetical protein SAMN05216570_3895 [Dyella sp. OK004]|uniref:hypothetical protein n=1 Tax=Dyella sp. OK004 TaxID=1855292 RepID=UPI0008DFB646|nr:hypothetical protein [Dyella sp. OK004]SFS19098.1 hypothetical protein SAMN05216570_3895 [Dyella sp. OK004]